MCRLLAYAAPHATTVSEVIGEMRSDAFQHMTTVHSDGWGTAWLAAGPGEPTPEVESLRISTPGQDDPVLTTILRDTPSPARLVHLRLATDSHKRTMTNTHPFIAEGIAFAHNGTISPTSRFHRLLEPSSFAGVSGDTDSELYFALVRQYARRLGSLGRGLVEAVGVLREVFPTASLNATLMSENELLVVRASSTAHVTVDTFAEYGVDVDLLPIDHNDDYYRMKMLRRADGTTVFASSGIDQDDWQEVPDDTVTRIDLRTLDFAQRSVLAAGTGEAVEADERAAEAVEAAAGEPFAGVGAQAGGAAYADPVSLEEHRARRAS
ncbi:class II glutamine amidotransferase [Pseudoclavibacter endophyticus]|nr:class II glutamine amidotransferase [Pseudoclavibacter endophyticus]GGA69628.1 class II glutamine amidotransferase [Pseudoclavibacter endophyticus]